jgi:protein-S-isoprenylcysteine O-methyltransferase Ste14
MDAPSNGQPAFSAVERLRSSAAGLVVVALACTAYLLGPHNAKTLARVYGTGGFSFTGSDFLVAACAGYGCVLALYCYFVGDPRASKSLRFLQVLLRLVRSPRTVLSAPLDREDRVAVLATLLKMFFAPLMAMQLMLFCMGAWANGYASLRGGIETDSFRAIFDRYGFWFVLQTIMFFDVLVFTVGYLVESPRLGNQIRSVDASWRGWLAALLCYPPFNIITGWIFGSAITEFPQFSDATTHIVLNVVVLVLWGIYASASVSLGWKASNLTHRGIVARGPYAIVRHPAYMCKNMAWWIGSLPLVSAAFDASLLAGLQAFASVVAVTMLYALRAITEEDHLRSVDGEYAAYAARVRYRFIPGLL